MTFAKEMKMITQIVLASVFTTMTPSANAEIDADTSTHEREVTEKLNAEIFEIMERDRENFVEQLTKPHLIAFVVHVKSKQDRKLFRSIQGKIPSDALSYVSDIVPSGFYVVGILRPTSQEAFNGSRDTKKFVLPIRGDQWGINQILTADLSQLLKKDRANKAEEPTPNPPSD